MKKTSFIIFLYLSFISLIHIAFGEIKEDSVIPTLLKDIQKFVYVDEEILKSEQKVLNEGGYIPPSIAEVLPLLSEKGKRNILLFTAKEELFLHQQFTKILTQLSVTDGSVTREQISRRISFLLNFYITYNQVSQVWFDKMYEKKTNNNQKLDFNYKTLENSKVFSDSEMKSWKFILAKLDNIAQGKGKYYASRLLTAVKSKNLSSATSINKEWSNYLLTNYSEAKFSYLRETYFNHLQEIELFNYSIWQINAEIKLKSLNTSMNQTSKIQEESSQFEEKFNQISKQKSHQKHDESIPAWKKGAEDLKQFAIMSQKVQNLNHEFSNWIVLLRKTASELSTNSEDFWDLSLEGLQIQKNINYLETLRKDYWKNKIAYFNKEKTKEWLDHLTKSAVDTEQYKELSEQRQKTKYLAIIGAIFVVLVSALIIYILFKKNKAILNTKTALEISNQKNEVITNRILETLDVAQKVQESLVFPSKAELKKVFPKINIALSAPFQSVTGDFYWARSISDVRKVFCLIDCESHGSPAALCTVAVKQLLDKTALDKDILNVPKYFAEKFMKSMKQLPNINQMGTISHKGITMRLAQCCLLWVDSRRRELNYISDHTGMYILRATGELIQLPRTMNPATEAIKMETITLVKDDVLFVHSDGVKDRFVNIQDRKKGVMIEKKLGTKRLKEILDLTNEKRLLNKVVDIGSAFNESLDMYDCVEKMDDETAVFLELDLV